MGGGVAVNNIAQAFPIGGPIDKSGGQSSFGDAERLVVESRMATEISIRFTQARRRAIAWHPNAISFFKSTKDSTATGRNCHWLVGHDISVSDLSDVDDT